MRLRSSNHDGLRLKWRPREDDLPSRGQRISFPGRLLTKLWVGRVFLRDSAWFGRVFLRDSTWFTAKAVS